MAALGDLALHPATARHVATKLARHFIADDPPKDAVERIAKSFRDSGGDLRHVSEAVVREDAAWRGPFAKVRAPTDLAIAACRVTGVTPRGQQWAQGLRMLDQLPFYAPQPTGWPDDAASWISPETVLRRAQWCEAFAARVPDAPDPAALAERKPRRCRSRRGRRRHRAARPRAATAWRFSSRARSSKDDDDRAPRIPGRRRRPCA